MQYQTNFYDFEWHDATIMKIVIDKQNPYSHKQIRIDVQWPEPSNAFNSIYFVDFKEFHLNYFGGILSNEEIINADFKEITKMSLDRLGKYEYITIERASGRKRVAYSNEKLYEYKMDTAPSNCLITIIAKGFYVTALSTD